MQFSHAIDQAPIWRLDPMSQLVLAIISADAPRDFASGVRALRGKRPLPSGENGRRLRKNRS